MTTTEANQNGVSKWKEGDLKNNPFVDEEDVIELNFSPRGKRRISWRRGGRWRRRRCRNSYGEKSCLLEWLALKEGTLNKI